MSFGFGGSSYKGPVESNYLFIDGGCLRTILNDYSIKYFEGEKIDIDYSRLTLEFTKHHQRVLCFVRDVTILLHCLPVTTFLPPANYRF